MELKDILSYLGYEADKVKTVDDFKASFDKDFVRPSVFKETDAYKGLQGEVLGAATVKVKNTFKNLGIELETDETKGKPLHEILAIGETKIKDHYAGKIKELESKAGQTNDEALKEWQIKAEKATAKLKDFEGLLSTTTGEFEKYKNETENKFKSFKIDSYKKSVMDKHPLISTASPLEKKGFEIYLQENYIIDFDEDGETPIVKTAKGERIKSETTTGKFKGFDEVFESEAKKAGLLQVTKPATQANTRTTFTPESTPGQAQEKKAFIHPNALK